MATSPARAQLWTEFFCLYIGMPALWLSDLSLGVKGGCLAVGIAFVGRALMRMTAAHRSAWGYKPDPRPRVFIYAFLLFVLITSVSVLLLRPDTFLSAPLETPLLWLGLFFIYSVAAVYPQEVVYRALFAERYATLFTKEMAPFVNAAVFSWAHAFFESPIVYFLSFSGGVVLYYSFMRSRSVVAVSLQHMVFAFWVLAVGLGDQFLLSLPAR